jgi:hypothetical protein
MSTALRLDDALVREAELEARLSKRTTPKQIEFWAEIGRVVAGELDPRDLIALTQGFARLRVEAAPGRQVDPDAVFASVRRERAAGSLPRRVTRAAVVYEASQTHPGQLDRVLPDGTRETGSFRDGEFHPSARR